MKGVTVDQVDAVVEESFLKKKVAANLHGHLESNNVATVRSCIFRSNVCYFTADINLYC